MSTVVTLARRTAPGETPFLVKAASIPLGVIAQQGRQILQGNQAELQSSQLHRYAHNPGPAPPA